MSGEFPVGSVPPEVLEAMERIRRGRKPGKASEPETRRAKKREVVAKAYADYCAGIIVSIEEAMDKYSHEYLGAKNGELTKDQKRNFKKLFWSFKAL